jgi:hypothetical protein
MNCKPGELARIVTTPFFKEHLGKIVLIVRAGRRSFVDGSETWETDPILRSPIGNEIIWCDRDLRPIRPGESTKESIEAMRLLHQIEEKV